MEQLQKINLMQGAGMIVVMCLFVLAIVLFRRRMQLILGLVLRFLCGVAGIYLVNLLMERAAFEAEIGINPVTVLVTTILGIPGLAMLYGIKIVSLL
ncbi:MAG: pro-sigmaK processing inhibitor BofA family protein [Lachnospiraceae bacterium]